MGIVERESGTQRDRQTERQKISNRQYSKIERKTIAKTQKGKTIVTTEKKRPLQGQSRKSIVKT